MATSASLGAVIGSTGNLHTEGGDLTVQVTVKDAREVWGRTDYLVTPTAGSGETWVSCERVSGLQIPTTSRRGDR
jgi:hypothetical protein